MFQLFERRFFMFIYQSERQINRFEKNLGLTQPYLEYGIDWASTSIEEYLRVYKGGI